MTTDDFRDALLAEVDSAAKAGLSLEQIFGGLGVVLHRVQVAWDIEIVCGATRPIESEPQA